MTEGPPADGHVVEFALTEDDLVAFANVGWGPSVLLRFDVGTLRVFVFLAVLVIVPLLGLAGGSQNWWEDPGFRHRAVGVIGVAFLGLFVFERPLLTSLLRRRIRAGRFGDLTTKRRLELTWEGIRFTTRTTEHTGRWDEIRKIAASPAGLCLIYDKRHGLCVPRRAFATASDFSAFVNAARTFKRDHAAMAAGQAGKMDP